MNKLLFLIIYPGCCLISSATTKKGKKTIKSVGDKYAPPYEYFNREFEPIGFNVDLIKEIMERLDQPYVIELGVWDDVLDSLKNGNADLIIGMVYFNDRANEYSFGAVHSFLDYSLVAKKDAVIRKISDLEGKNILVQKGRATDILLKNKGVTSNIIYIDIIRYGITRMSDGEACYMLCPGNTASWFIPGRGMW